MYSKFNNTSVRQMIDDSFFGINDAVTETFNERKRDLINLNYFKTKPKHLKDMQYSISSTT